MDKKYIFLIFAVVICAPLVYGTSGADVVSHDETDVLQLEPAGEGIYTQVDDETGEISIIVTGENPALAGGGVNNDAVTSLGPVFTIENVLEQQREATVWIEDGSEAVEFYVPGAGTVESEAGGAVMRPGDSVTVAMRVDTRETDSITLDDIQVLATLDPAVDEGAGGPPADTGPSEDVDPPADTGPPADPGGGSSDGAQEMAEPPASPTPTVTRESGSESGATGSPTVTPSTTPTATPGLGPRRARLVDGRAEFDAGWVDAVEFEESPDGIVSVRYPDELTAETPAPPGEARGLADIDVPDGLPERSADVAFHLTDGELGDADPADVTLAHYDEDEGWTTHEATARRADGGYVFTAETDEFSVFAVTVLESSSAAEAATATADGSRSESESSDAAGSEPVEPGADDNLWPFGDSPVPLAVLSVASMIAAVLFTRLVVHDR